MPSPTPTTANVRRTLLGRGIPVPDVYADDRRSFRRKWISLMRDHPEDYSQWYDSVSGTQEAADIAVMIFGYKEHVEKKTAEAKAAKAAKDPPASTTRQQQQPTQSASGHQPSGAGAGADGSSDGWTDPDDEEWNEVLAAVDKAQALGWLAPGLLRRTNAHTRVRRLPEPRRMPPPAAASDPP
ncbi:unnamed protein product [Vitrella brassicaformis CCMP3155]|uniref:Uncharacterized protein n=1 Tax=Vitrella brassicaformis (strain CCMP3155) TaxID=1169540 RepID=A0A0G4GRR3_VITBC|nr:unnamed protein product [Vitrella brassicaformis CCMP3155]|eukprot:CEM33258.1 unnamed protein product [Vitrella brassicaformis CCMP3155]